MLFAAWSALHLKKQKHKVLESKELKSKQVKFLLYSPPLPGCHAVRIRVQRHRAGGGAPGLVPAGRQEGVLRRLPVHLLRPTAARRGAGNRLATQHHGFLHAIFHPGHEGIPIKGGSAGGSRTEMTPLCIFFKMSSAPNRRNLYRFPTAVTAVLKTQK